MEKATNDKVLALYQAVWEMIQEGQNVYQMKVIDITNRAGIGKGTAYEYFRSKEEIVDRALQYYSNLEFQQIRTRIEAEKTLRGAFDVCFDWLDQYQDRMEGLVQLIKNIGSTQGAIQRGFAKMEANMPEGTARVQMLLDSLVLLGRTDGVVADQYANDYVSLQILSQMMGYFTYTRFRVKDETDKKKEVREFLYNTFLNGLKN